MPIFGKLETTEHAASAPTITRLMSQDDEFSVEDVSILAFTAEIDIEKGFLVTPKALHPSLPSYCQIVVRRHPEGAPFGAFTFAELRVNTRAGTNYVGYCVGAFTDNPGAAEFFASRYGVHVRQADVRLERSYFGIDGRVDVDGETVFHGRLQKPHFISGSDVLYTPDVHLARVPAALAGTEGGDDVLRLVHQEMEYTIGRAERGDPVIDTFDAAAFGDGRLVLRHDLPATLTESKVTYTAARYLIDPDQAAMTGTRSLAA
jgi:hypothetical protein